MNHSMKQIRMAASALTQPAFTCSKSTTEPLEQGVFIVNSEHISHLVPVFLLLTLNM